MAKDETILEKLKEHLEDDTTLSEYVTGGVFIGDRENVVTFPCLMIEPINIIESDDTNPYQDLTMIVRITGLAKIQDKDLQIIGNDEVKGILNFLTDVKKALSADRRLDSNAKHMTFTEATFVKKEYPIRAFELIVEILYRQTATTRT